MGFWQKLFGRKEQVKNGEIEWEEVAVVRDKVNFHDEEQRSRYVTDCLEQIAEASKELDTLNGEYSLVTSYLTDMEEVEALPEEEKEILELIARKLQGFEQERLNYKGKKDRMPDSEFYGIHKQESEIEDGIRKLKEAEGYHVLVKQDMKRLDGEKHAYDYRRQELENLQANYRGMAVIFLTALVICLFMLAILQYGFGMNTFIGYFVAVIAAAVAVVMLCIKYLDADRERIRVENSTNKLIQLHNKVKIRYVNNVNLLDYLYIKYNTDSAARLEKRWGRYQQEKEERKQYAEAEARIGYYQKQLVEQLRKYRVRTPERWVSQVNAILDKREMVEIRHELIMRRQALRKQLDYNAEVAKSARKEITDIVTRFPKYAGEIMEMVDRYEKKFR